MSPVMLTAAGGEENPPEKETLTASSGVLKMSSPPQLGLSSDHAITISLCSNKEPFRKWLLIESIGFSIARTIW